MTTVQDYIQEIDDCIKIIEDANELREWIDNDVKTSCPVDSFIVEIVVEKIEAYIDILKNTKVVRSK